MASLVIYFEESEAPAWNARIKGVARVSHPPWGLFLLALSFKTRRLGYYSKRDDVTYHLSILNSHHQCAEKTMDPHNDFRLSIN